MEGLRKQLERRQGALKKSRETWDITVRDICEMMHPYGGVFDEQYKERNMGQRLDDQIIDPKPIEAVNISVAGLISSMTNPAKKWFGITTSDDALSELPEVKRHLEIERQQRRSPQSPPSRGGLRANRRKARRSPRRAGRSG